MTTATDTYRIRFKRDGQDYKTASRNGETQLPYNTAAEVFNNIKDKGIACWMFKLDENGKNVKVVHEFKPELPDQTEEF